MDMADCMNLEETDVAVAEIIESEEQLSVAEEGIDDPDADEEIIEDDVVYDVSTYGADFTLDGLVNRIERGDIFRPEFQRNFVWTLAQASRFIESILLGLPIPSVFLFREKSSERLLIVDGLQRLYTLRAFYQGVFAHNDRAFRLRHVKPRFEGKAMENLASEDLRRFENSVIHANIIRQHSPSVGDSSAYHIFDRLNSSGTPLVPQEIRSAVYNGPFQKRLGEMAEFREWRKFFGAAHKRLKDQEMILRFLALSYKRKEYESPMKTFLNSFMQTNRHAGNGRLDEFSELFESTITRVVRALGPRAFRMTGPINVAVFDSVMVAVGECPQAGDVEICRAHDGLLENGSFVDFTSKSTANVANVNGRINLAIEAINAAL